MKTSNKHRRTMDSEACVRNRDPVKKAKILTLDVTDM